MHSSFETFIVVESALGSGQHRGGPRSARFGPNDGRFVEGGPPDTPGTFSGLLDKKRVIAFDVKRADGAR